MPGVWQPIYADRTSTAAAQPLPCTFRPVAFVAPLSQPPTGLIGPASGLINMPRNLVITISFYFKAAAAEQDTKVTQQSCFDSSPGAAPRVHGGFSLFRALFVPIQYHSPPLPLLAKPDPF